MIYIAAILTGLLLGFLIKDRIWMNEKHRLTIEVYQLLAYLYKFIANLTPLAPDEFLKSFSEKTTGVGYVGNQMFLVQKKSDQLVTLTDYPLKQLLGKHYEDLLITAFIPSKNLIRDVLNRIKPYI
jgi:hypothetical protein